MFWGLIMEPHKRYTQIVEKSFHVSMASLDASTAGTEIVQVMLCYDNRNYLLCSLKGGTIWQVPLDLNFEEGTKIAFTSNGSGHVHLTGYLVPDEPDFDIPEDEEDEDEEIPELVTKSSKRKASDSPKQIANNLKRTKQTTEEAESSEDDGSDEDLQDEDGDDSEENVDEMEDEEEDEEDDEDEDEEEDEDEDSEDEETKPAPKKNKQTQQQQQQQQQVQQKNAKQDKQKLVNGKAPKPDAKQQEKPQKKSKSEQQPLNNQQESKKRTIQGGVQVEDLKVGSGTVAKSGKFVTVYYVGKLKNGKKFDSCNQGEGFKFRIGKNEVIQGWDIGIAGMKVGGRRRLTIPPAMAYGAKGSPPVIPPNAPLLFEVELRNVQ